MDKARELDLDHSVNIAKNRKIPVEVLVEMGLVSHDKASVAFEYRRKGKCEYRKILRVRSHPDGSREKSFSIEPTGATLFPFNIDSLAEWSRPQDVLIITEGEFDAMAARAAGEVFVISVPNGANREKVGTDPIDPLNDGGFAWLWDGPRLLPTINCFDKIVLAVDNDAKGHVLREELAVRLGRERCWWPAYPEDCKDCNEVLVKHGEAALQDALNNATPLVKDRLISFRDLPVLKDAVEYTTGFNDIGDRADPSSDYDERARPRKFDQRMRINIPELMVVLGAPGAGKSTWCLSLVAQLAELHNMPGAILQFEDSPKRNYDQLVQFKLRNVRGTVTDADRAKAEIWVDNMFRTVAPSDSLEEDQDFTFKWLKEAIWEAVKRHGAMWVLIDPWNEIEHAWSVNESETRYTNEALRQMKRMARKFNILLIIAAHPTKQAGLQREITNMSLYDVSGSAAWKNKADHGVIIFRPEGSDDTIVKVDKCKNHSTMGTPGTVYMRYNPDLCTFWYRGVYVPPAAT